MISHILTISKKNDYELLLDWGKNNSIYISDKISMNYTNENNKYYYVKKKINKDEIIMSVPNDIALTLNSSLNLLGRKTRKQYENYQKQKFEEEKRQGQNDIIINRKIQSFLAYLMAIANKNKSRNNRFYQFYKYYFNTFETNVEKFPIFFDSNQINYLMFSKFGNDLLEMKEMFEEEYGILHREIFKNTLEEEDYFKYRIFTFSKLIDISGHSSLIPFVDMIDINPINYNLKLNFTYENNSISVTAIKTIDIEDKLVMSAIKLTNSASFLCYGKIFEENKNYIESFTIPKVSQYFIDNKKIDPLLVSSEIIDIFKDNYYKEILPDYMELSKLLREDGSKVSALRLFLENLQFIRNSYNKVTVGELYKYFYDITYVRNIRSILDSEKHYLDKKIREMKQIINKYAKEKEQDL